MEGPRYLLPPALSRETVWRRKVNKPSHQSVDGHDWNQIEKLLFSWGPPSLPPSSPLIFFIPYRKNLFPYAITTRGLARHRSRFLKLFPLKSHCFFPSSLLQHPPHASGYPSRSGCVSGELRALHCTAKRVLHDYGESVWPGLVTKNNNLISLPRWLGANKVFAFRTGRLSSQYFYYFMDSFIYFGNWEGISGTAFYIWIKKIENIIFKGLDWDKGPLNSVINNDSVKRPKELEMGYYKKKV